MRILIYILVFVFGGSNILLIAQQETYPTEDNIEYDGNFKDGKFWSGHRYIYDQYGLLDHIEVYKKGVYVGNGVIGKQTLPEKDTLNQRDKDEKKAGYWINRGKSCKHEKGYTDTTIVEEGYYKRSRKIGIWKKYWPNGNQKSVREFKNGRTTGNYMEYYLSGCVEAIGTYDSIYSFTLYNDDCDTLGIKFGTIDSNYRSKKNPYVRYYYNGINSKIINNDTVNQVDSLGKQTGYWRITATIKKVRGYSDSSLIEEGNYVRGRKVGDWVKYWPNGSTKQEAVYKNGRPNGIFITYHENGRINEKGTWTRNHYINEFRAYYESGCLKQFKHFYADSTYTDYYFDDCDTAFSEKGELELSYSTYPGYDNKYTNIEERLYYKSERKDSIPKLIGISGHRTYNSNGDILMEGEFKKGRLWNGRYFIYTKEGKLDHIEVYKEGKFVGNGVLKGEK